MVARFGLALCYVFLLGITAAFVLSYGCRTMGRPVEVPLRVADVTTIPRTDIPKVDLERDGRSRGWIVYHINVSGPGLAALYQRDRRLRVVGNGRSLGPFVWVDSVNVAGQTYRTNLDQFRLTRVRWTVVGIGLTAFAGMMTYRRRRLGFGARR